MRTNANPFQLTKWLIRCKFLTIQLLFFSSHNKGLGLDDIDISSDISSVPEQLQHLEFKYVNSIDCQEAMGDGSPTVTENMMCAQGPGEDQYSGVCYGDSGGECFSVFTTHIHIPTECTCL